LRKSGREAMNEGLMEEVVKEGNIEVALRAVEENEGAPGVDGMTTKELRSHIKRNGARIWERMLNGEYRPSPVRRKEIDKPEGGKRMLGIPTVQDRMIQQMLLQVLTPIFEPLFSESSYGFRPGRSAHDAVRKAQEYAKEGKTSVVDIDISKFFDNVNHDKLLHRIGKEIRDKRVLKLIGRYLRGGIMAEGLLVRSEKGTPQGGPLSPILANIYLDALDKELERRGHKYARYADDSNIYVGSLRAAKRVMESISEWIEKELRLEVNRTKSGVGYVWERKFLGFTMTQELEIKISDQSIKRFKDKVRDLWASCQSLTSEELRDNWRVYLQGWWGYYRLAENLKNILGLEGWIRRHIRKCFWLRWHNKAGRLNALRRLGLYGRWLLIAYSSRGAWRIAKCPSMHKALSNRVLSHYGFLMPSELVTV
jgi:RNA-directed DNA polymerase